MKKWVSSLFDNEQPDKQEPEEDMLGVQKELQEARLELVAHEQAIQRLSRENESLRLRQSELMRDAVSAEVEAILRDSAAPAAQLATQAYLVEKQGRLLQTRDVLSVAKRLVHALEKHGLTLQGVPGEVEPFDPNWHLPLSTSQTFEPGQNVVIRFPAVTCRERILARAGVEAQKEGE